jgi:fumarate reductase flavoprotein subunit
MSNMEADVIVVAGGPAGLAAAISAAEGGAKVILFEKGSTTGGAANMGMGPFAVESRIQKAKQVALTKDEAFKQHMDHTHWRVDAKLVRAYYNKSADTIDWLENMGVVFADAASYFPGAHFTWHIVMPESGKPGPTAGATMTKIMTEKAKTLGVKVMLQTPVTDIIKQGDDIKGVKAEDRSGNEITANAKVVIVATGGFGDNPKMIKKNTEYEFGKDMHNFRVPGVEGDGIRMAWKVGAAKTHMDMEMIYGIPEGGLDFALMATFHQPNLMVNLLGERFVNEDLMGNSTYTGNAIAQQKNRCGFAIFDTATREHYEQHGFDHPLGIAADLKVDDIEAVIKNSIDQGCPYLYIADSLEELAEKTGINLEGLKATLEEYNGYAEKGRDPLFNRNWEHLHPVKGPRYYACCNMPSAYGSLGGIKINHKTEVLDKNWDKIPGLYAAGTDACTIFGDSYVFLLPGNTMGFALNSGRMAGENAAEYIKTLG